jgi:hemerythrin superfamily protein
MALFGTNPVFAMLKEDHQKVKELFEQFEHAEDGRTKKRIMQEAIRELDVHAALEESLIYPAIRKEIEEEDVMDEALEEHHVAHVLLNELKRTRSSNSRSEAKFKVLGESVKHHIQEEEGSMFPKAEKLELDWEELAQESLTRKEALMERKGNRRAPRKGKKVAHKTKRRHLRKAA